MNNPNAVTLLHHKNGLDLDPQVVKSFDNFIEHDPSDINKAREYAELPDSVAIGLFYQDENAYRYDEYGAHNLGMTNEERIAGINMNLDKYAV